MARRARSKRRSGRRGWVALALLGVLAVSGCASPPAGPGRTHAVIGHDDGGARTLLLQPVDGGRLSSTFGMRMHPILGRRTLHRGVDYAAPEGTPIRAAGDGLVVHAGLRGGYGHLVRIRHDHSYATAYAHLSDYAPGLAVGRQVRQGEVIGFVGSSGRSTGPHLHFEVLARGEPVDPFAVGPTLTARIRDGALGTLAAARDGVRNLGSRLQAPVAAGLAGLGEGLSIGGARD